MKCVMNKVLLLAILGFTTVGVAQTQKSDGTAKSQVSKEDRERMAKVHENMASCLRSDKSIEQCHEQMRGACKDAGPGACGMGMMGHHGMGRGEK